MAKKYLDPILHTAQIIANDINLSALTYYNKSPHDKTFSAVILGVNQKFTDRVSSRDREEIIEKFGIPETVENGGNYYTFRIDGAYYVKRSVFPFKLYDEIRVRVPNGNWSNMFIENGVKEDAFVPEVIYSQTEPTAEEYTLRVGDIWIKTDENGSLVSVYEYRTAESGEDEETVYEWTLKTSVPAVIYSADEPTEVSYALNTGDVWIETDNDTDKKAKAVYEYVIKDDTAEVPEYEWQIRAVIPTGSGVGKAVGFHSEIFNDYSYNSVTEAGQGYNHVEGYNNKLNSCDCTHVGGSLNVINHAENSAVYGYNNTSGIAALLMDCGVYGYNNTISGRNYHSLFCGGENKTEESNSSVIGGAYNTIENAVCSSVSGMYNTVDISSSVMSGVRNSAENSTNSLIAGEYNIVNNLRSGIVAGLCNYGSNFGLVCGRFNAEPRGGVYAADLVIGIGTKSDNRRNGLSAAGGDLHIAGTLYQQGADYAECFEWLDGNPDNEDRRGMLVSLSGDRIIPANGDDVFGIVSAMPTVCANSAPMEWQKRFVRDVFGAIVYDGNNEPVLNPEYDEKAEYIPRTKRKEWAAVGIIGRLVVRDNGTCEPGKYCKALDGIAVSSDTKTNIRVLRRIDDKHAEVFIKV